MGHRKENMKKAWSKLRANNTPLHQEEYKAKTDATTNIISGADIYDVDQVHMTTTFSAEDPDWRPSTPLFGNPLRDVEFESKGSGREQTNNNK